MPTEPAHPPVDEPATSPDQDGLGEADARTLFRTATRGPARLAFVTGTAGRNEDGEGDLWLISYADMMTLLFAVFVIVVSIVGLSPQDAAGPYVAGPVQAAPSEPLDLRPLDTPIFLGESETPGFLAPRIGKSLPRAFEKSGPDQAPPMRQSGDPDGLAEYRKQSTSADVSAKYLASVGLDGLAAIDDSGDTVRLAIATRAIFDGAGSTEVSEDGRRILARLYPLLATRDSITIEATTAAWNTGSAQAGAIARVLTDLGISAKALSLKIRSDAESGQGRRVVMFWGAK